MSKLSVSLLASAIAFATPAAWAASPSSSSSPDSSAAEPGRALDPIVVTATLGPETVGESLSSVTVLNNDQIRRQQPREFRDLLQAQPGVNVVSDGSYGKTTSVFLRGAGSSGTVLLLDGIRLRSATAGIPPWQFLPPDLISRLEVVRGAKSSLYGADAVGGVIQAFTLDPKPGKGGWVEASGGSNQTGSAGAGVTLNEDGNSLLVAGDHLESDGTSLREGGEDRGFRNTGGLVRARHAFEQGGGVGVTFLQSSGNTEFEGGDTDYTIQAGSLYLDAVASDTWRTRVQFTQSRDEQETYGDYPSVYDTLSRSARWENTLTAGVQQFIIGTELSTDEVDGTDTFAEDSRTNTAVFGQALLNFQKTDVTASLRMDDNDAYGRKETGGLALGYRLDASHRARLSYATSFRAPTFNDLYLVTPYYTGNPDLSPEKGQMVEAGISGHYTTFFWDVAVYQNDVRDLITYVSDPNTFIGTVENVETARIRGVELSAGYQTTRWDLRGSLAYADSENRDTGKRLPRRARTTARLDVDRLFGLWSVGASAVAEGDRYSDAANDLPLAGFATLDLRGSWQFLPDWTARLKLANVFDRRYATSVGYDSATFEPFDYLAAGRTVMATVRYDVSL
ncbi:TonB-dependent receptor plug domain-containing protein [Marinobacter sp. C2H3]|uniref:TonB-dependent receptor plug domain-containing protein n=1 Tax=Marinobacter sp. C2H3 TaxID=3119003 RepID=UPI00300E8FD3